MKKYPHCPRERVHMRVWEECEGLSVCGVTSILVSVHILCDSGSCCGLQPISRVAYSSEEMRCSTRLLPLRLASTSSSYVWSTPLLLGPWTTSCVQETSPCWLVSTPVISGCCRAPVMPPLNLPTLLVS